MSAFSGRQSKGAKRVHREYKRDEAQARQKDFDAEAAKTAHDQNISEAQARKVTSRSRRLDRKVGDKVA